MFMSTNRPLMLPNNYQSQNSPASHSPVMKKRLIIDTKPLQRTNLMTSSPSIASLKNDQKISIPANTSRASFINSKSNISEHKKFHSTTTLNTSVTISSLKHSEQSTIEISYKKEVTNVSDKHLAEIESDKVNEDEDVPQFKSIREKIAYFSSRAKQTKHVVSSSVQGHLNNSTASLKKSFNSQQDISSNVNRNVIGSCLIDTSASKQGHKIIQGPFGKSCVNSKATHSMNNSTKSELKSMIHANENKISNLIENIETKMKHG